MRIFNYFCVILLVVVSPSILKPYYGLKVWGERAVLYKAVEVRFSVYHAVEGQTDDTPRVPADVSMYLTDDRISSKSIAAISPYLKEKYNLKWGDTLYVEGCKQITEVYLHDLTNERYKNTLDLLVPTYIDYPSQINCPDKVRLFVVSK